MIRKPITLEREVHGGRTVPTPAIEFRLATHRPDGMDDEGFDVAVTTITRERAQKLVGWINVVAGLQAAAGQTVLRLEVWDDIATYYAAEKFEESEGGDVGIPIIPEDDDHQVDCGHILVSDDGIEFRGYMGESDLMIRTESIPRVVLEALAAMPDPVPAGSAA